MNYQKNKNSIKKEFDSEPVYFCLSVILIDSIFKTGKNYYPQLLLEESKYLVQKNRSLSILLTTQKFLLYLIKKFPMKKILVKKILKNGKHFKTFRVILSYSLNGHVTYIILKAYKIFLIFVLRNKGKNKTSI